MVNKAYIDFKNTVIRNYGSKCVCCGEDGIEFLAIDHIYSDGNIERKTIKNTNSLYKKLIKENFPKDRYRILCHSCNIASYRNGGVCPHFIKNINNL